MTFPFPRRGRSLAAGQRSELVVIDLDGKAEVIFSAGEVIEAPNWSADGQWLVFNAGGRLYRIAPAGGQPEQIDTGPLASLNNDHVLSPDGSTIYVSSDDGHLHALPFAGALARARGLTKVRPMPLLLITEGTFQPGWFVHQVRHAKAQDMLLVGEIPNVDKLLNIQRR